MEALFLETTLKKLLEPLGDKGSNSDLRPCVLGQHNNNGNIDNTC